MKVVIRLSQRGLGERIANALAPMTKFKGNEISDLPTTCTVSEETKKMLFEIGLPYSIYDYVYIENRGVVEVFELLDPVFAGMNPHDPDRLSGLCLWKRFNHTFCRDQAELLEALVAYLLTN